jgi:hypothetical protein
MRRREFITLLGGAVSCMAQWVCRTMSLPSTRWQIPVADLNCSEFRVLPPRW